MKGFEAQNNIDRGHGINLGGARGTRMRSPATRDPDHLDPAFHCSSQDCGSSRHRMSGVCAFRGQNFASSCPEVVRPGGSGDPSHVRICAPESQKLLLLHASILRRRHHEESLPGWQGYSTHGRGFRHKIWSRMAHRSPKVCQMGVELGKTLSASHISPKPSQSVEYCKKT